MFRNIEFWWVNVNTNMDLWADIYDQVYIDVNDDIDFYVQELCDKYPKLDEYYGLRSNKGYGARIHMEGIKQYGISPWHRKSFGLCKHAKIIHF